jgi:DNA-binding MarR family transcriptional regulator
MPRSRQSKKFLAAGAWRVMFDYLMATSPARARVLERRRLTPNDARALWSLDPGDGRPIGSLAREWACDPANATFIVGRLEAAGLARRRDSDRDRRVKLVALTPKGAATKAAILREYQRPPRELGRLSRADLEALVAVLAKLWPGG